MRLLARLVVVLLVGLGLPAVASAPAQAAACPRGTGVTVVVNSDVRCLPGTTSGTARSAFEAAGHTLTPVQQPGFFVCRVNGFPDVSCADTPPADAYWAFWVSSGNGTWSYASIGVAGQRVKAGDWVGLAWSTGGGAARPGVTPSGPAAGTGGGSGGGSTGGSTGGSGGGSTGSAGGGSGSTGGSGSAGGSSAGGSSTGSGSGGSRGSTGGGSSSGSSPDDSRADDPDAPTSSDDDPKDADDPQETEAPADGREPSAASEEPADERTEATAATSDGPGSGPWVAGAVILAVLAASGVTLWRRRASAD